MSRIRSVHPGIWTDEDFVTLSSFARLLLIGLWNECDDKGIFEWKPVTLKMRLLPADNVDAAALLDEIAKAGAIMRYEIGGKAYGAVRNFGKFQRPKKPNDIHPATQVVLAFCGIGSEPDALEADYSVNDFRTSSPPVPHQFPTAGEIAPQMEDGGGRGEEEGVKAYAFSAGVVRLKKSDYDDWRNRFHGIPDFDAELTALAGWLADQNDEKRRKWFATGAGWLNRRHQEAVANRQRAGPEVVIGI